MPRSQRDSENRPKTQPSLSVQPRHAASDRPRTSMSPPRTGEPQELGRIVRAEKPRLVLLDVVLPGEDGIALLQRIPELPDLPDLPVIFISGYGRDEIIARALESGAADYIVKPFSPTELVARVRAALRRYEEPGLFVFGELAIDYDRRQVTVGGNTAALTATEYELLRMLSLNAGRVVAYNTLLNRLWNKLDNGDTNLVRICIRNLCHKLGNDAVNPVWIFNERGVGYRMAEPGKE